MSVEHYMAARADFTNVRAEVSAISGTVAEVASSLQTNPGGFIFSNQPIGLPMEATFSRTGRSVDAGRWPTVEQIMRVLERWHRARDALRNHWEELTPSQKEALKSPDDLLGRGY